MNPRNGNYSCDGPQTTGALCSFQCNAGYELVGLTIQTCLSNGKWSGNTSCQILHCDELNNPENGNVILPCGTKLSTTCSIQCSPGYYTQLNDPIQQCELMAGNTVKWTEPPDCIGKGITVLVYVCCALLGHNCYNTYPIKLCVSKIKGKSVL